MFDSIIEFITDLLNGSLLFQGGIAIWNGLIGYAWDILQTNPQALADGMLWDTVDGVFQLLQIVGASLMTVLFLINFVKETADIRHNTTLESAFVMIMKLIIGNVVLLNLKEIILLIVSMEQNLLEIVAPSGNASLQLTIPGLDDWEISVQGTILGMMMGLLFVIVAIAGVIVILWTAYGVFFKIFFYIATAPLAMSTILGTQGMSHSAYAWIKTFLCALGEIAGIVLVLRLGAALINAQGFFPSMPSGGVWDILGPQVWGGLQCTLSIIVITGAVKSVDSMIRRAFGF